MMITVARTALWVSCIGSLLLFGIYLHGIGNSTMLNSIDKIIPSNISNLTTTLPSWAKDVPDWWQAASGILTGLGATIARRHHSIDSKLNGTRYWVAKTEKNGNILSVEWGILNIQNIQKMRKIAPANVVSGKTKDITPRRADANSDFRATDILIGEQVDTKFYYEWMSETGGRSGISRLTYTIAPRDGFWNKVFKRTKLDLHGKFMPDSGDATGDIEYFEDEVTANARYQQLRLKI